MKPAAARVSANPLRLFEPQNAVDFALAADAEFLLADAALHELAEPRPVLGRVVQDAAEGHALPFQGQREEDRAVKMLFYPGDATVPARIFDLTPGPRPSSPTILLLQ